MGSVNTEREAPCSPTRALGATVVDAREVQPSLHLVDLPHRSHTTHIPLRESSWAPSPSSNSQHSTHFPNSHSMSFPSTHAPEAIGSGSGKSRFQTLVKKAASQNKVDIKLGRTAAQPTPSAPQSVKAVALAALAQHREQVLTRTCERVATEPFKSLPRPTTNEQRDAAYACVDKYWAPAFFALCLYYFWRVPLALSFRTAMAWGPFEACLLLLLGVMEIAKVALDLRRPHDVRGQRVYTRAEIWRVVCRDKGFWFSVAAAAPVQLALAAWLTSDAWWVACAFAVKFLRSLCVFGGQFNVVLERLHVSPVRARICHSFFIFLLCAHLCACAFMVVAHQEGDDNTQYITSVPGLVSCGERCLALQYTQALDFSIKHMTGLGRGENMPLTDLQYVLLLCTSITGVILYAMIVATISTSLASPSLKVQHLHHLQQVRNSPCSPPNPPFVQTWGYPKNGHPVGLRLKTKTLSDCAFSVFCPSLDKVVGWVGM